MERGFVKINSILADIVLGDVTPFAGISNFANKNKEKVSCIFSKVEGWFSDTFNLKRTSDTSNKTSNKSTTNNSIIINTTSSAFDINSINRALGG